MSVLSWQSGSRFKTRRLAPPARPGEQVSIGADSWLKIKFADRTMRELLLQTLLAKIKLWNDGDWKSYPSFHGLWAWQPLNRAQFWFSPQIFGTFNVISFGGVTICGAWSGVKFFAPGISFQAGCPFLSDGRRRVWRICANAAWTAPQKDALLIKCIDLTFGKQRMCQIAFPTFTKTCLEEIEGPLKRWR